jgi:DNA-binding transcriptional ArsR family regulator
MSRHLRTLRECGLVAESHPEFDARVRIYALRREPMSQLVAWLDASDQMWSEQLAAFQRHLDDETGEGGR